MATAKKLQYKENLSMLFACISLLVFGGCALYENGGITYTSLIAAGIKIIPAVTVMYILGWLMGWIMEASKTVKKAKSIGYTNSLLEEILKEEGLDDLEGEDYKLNDDDFADVELEGKE